MKKDICIILSLVFGMHFVSLSQNISLDTLSINQIIEIVKKDTWVEGFGDGPYISGNLTIANNTNDFFYIGNSIFVSYCKDGFLCNSLPFYTSVEKESVVCSGDSITISFGIPLLFGLSNKYQSDTILNDYLFHDYSRYLDELAESICVRFFINMIICDVYPQRVIADKEPVFLK